jgi:hypothetical protein
MTDNSTNVVNMAARIKLIREAREAREKRDQERAANDMWADKHKPQYPGGIDDIKV